MAERCRTLRALERMLARIEGALPVYGELCLLLEHAAAGEEGEAAAGNAGAAAPFATGGGTALQDAFPCSCRLGSPATAAEWTRRLQ